MSTEFSASLIAFIGVVLSALIAYFTSVRQSKLEAKRHLAEIKNGFSERIFEKRLDIYPELFELLSNFQKKHIEANNFSRKVFQDLLADLLVLDSKARILFGGNTSQIAYTLRLMVAEQANKSDHELSEFYSASNNRDQLKSEINEYHVALKNELGIYAFENPLIVREFVNYQLYGRSTTRQ